ncbi:MAG: glycosyltransferase family 9 protein, partial [Gammaproteobacteria bacterium]
MKRVLIIKTSSLGDVIHTLPALTDAANNDPEIQFDWVVEESFAEIASWHPAVNDVIPVKIRAWRKSPLKTLRSDEWKLFKQKLKSVNYDTVIDAQGLLKSALLLPLTNGPRYGLDKH